MKNSIWYTLTVVCLLCSCVADPIIVEHEVRSNNYTGAGSRATTNNNDSTCAIRFAMYETFKGYVVKIDNVKIIQAPAGVEECSMENMLYVDHISEDIKNPTYNNPMKGFHFISISNSNTEDLVIEYDFTLRSEDKCAEEIKVKGATFTIPYNELRWAHNMYFTYLIRISEDTNGSTGEGVTGLHPITFDATVEEFGLNT